MVVERYLSVSYPLPRIKVTSPYGYRKDPFTGKRKFHGGIDLQARGDKVLAMMAGTVVKVGQDKTSGKYVTLQHGNCMISYCHLSKILVARGTAVRPRDAVGITGSTGRSTGEHLHITCRLNGKSVDPAILLNMSGEYSRNVFRHWPNYDFSPFDCMADTVAPYRHPDDGHRRHGKRLSIEMAATTLPPCLSISSL